MSDRLKDVAKVVKYLEQAGRVGFARVIQDLETAYKKVTELADIEVDDSSEDVRSRPRSRRSTKRSD